jgi:hypothetical protein
MIALLTRSYARGGGICSLTGESPEEGQMPQNREMADPCFLLMWQAARNRMVI